MSDFYKNSESNIDYEILSASSNGVIEFGDVELLIDGEEIIFAIEQSSDGSFRVFVDEYDEMKKHLKNLDIKGERNEIFDEKFVDAIYDAYQLTTQTQCGNWSNPEYD